MRARVYMREEEEKSENNIRKERTRDSHLQCSLAIPERPNKEDIVYPSF
jgi:hypothetical protein